MSNIRAGEITAIQILPVHSGLKLFQLACILFFTLLTAASRFSKATLALHRNPACSPANWAGQRSEGQRLWEEWISCFRIYNSALSWACALQWAGERTQLCQHFPQSRSASHNTPRPRRTRRCVCSGTGQWSSWRENKPLWNRFWHSAGEDGNIKAMTPMQIVSDTRRMMHEPQSHNNENTDIVYSPSWCWNTYLAKCFFSKRLVNSRIVLHCILCYALSIKQSFDHTTKHLNIILLLHIIGRYRLMAGIYIHFMQVVCYKDLI